MEKLKRAIPEKPVKLRIKKGDTVEVISGKDKGRRGEVIQAFPKLNKVKVKGVNIITRHRKERVRRGADPNDPARVIPGGRIEEEAPLYASKVMLVCPNCNRPTRVGYAYREGEAKPARRKYRVCKHPDCGKEIG
ncbi:50S ribosomal protein L24 [Chthonomonas sp.]|jgi:large subunit ribosomal protein L24|uniref:50S ribosomal protein L24 n=1 Tax=Chthonomonas sp. TaxID=2282153 RepID=UPI0031B88958